MGLLWMGRQEGGCQLGCTAECMWVAPAVQLHQLQRLSWTLASCLAFLGRLLKEVFDLLYLLRGGTEVQNPSCAAVYVARKLLIIFMTPIGVGSRNWHDARFLLLCRRLISAASAGNCVILIVVRAVKAVRVGVSVLQPGMLASSCRQTCNIAPLNALTTTAAGV
jgi:hypothetical protein